MNSFNIFYYFPLALFYIIPFSSPIFGTFISFAVVLFFFRPNFSIPPYFACFLLIFSETIFQPKSSLFLLLSFFTHISYFIIILFPHFSYISSFVFSYSLNSSCTTCSFMPVSIKSLFPIFMSLIFISSVFIIIVCSKN